VSSQIRLFTIRSRGERYSADVFDNRDSPRSYEFTGDFDVDVDGSPNWRRDPCGQPDTTLHYAGRPIDSDAVPGIVLPPECILFVPELVLGCLAWASYRGKSSLAVVFDVGPHSKLGEGSAELARRMGINADPNKGGVEEPEVLYRWWPGVPATVDGITYALQHYAK
jgi:hypothetical protein